MACGQGVNSVWSSAAAATKLGLVPIQLPDALNVDRTVMGRVPQTGKSIWVDRIAVTLSKIGEVSAIWFALAVIGFLTNRLSTREALVCVIAMTSEWVLTNRVVKHQLHRPRPTPERNDPKGVRRPTSSSFPSGHSSASALAATLVGWLTGWWPPMALLALAIGWSRIHLRVHYPTDVLAGWIWGFALGLGVLFVV